MGLSEPLGAEKPCQGNLTAHLSSLIFFSGFCCLQEMDLMDPQADLAKPLCSVCSVGLAVSGYSGTSWLNPGFNRALTTVLLKKHGILMWSLFSHHLFF